MAVGAQELAVVPLESERARHPAVTGAKAANLARAAARGLPVLPGFALVPVARAPGAPTGAEALRQAWRALSDAAGPDRQTAEGSAKALVVRSSSVHEDTAESSMAGRFESVLDVRGWEAFTAAVQQVLDSASRGQDVGQPPAEDGMAVLVQPMLRAAAGGVMFGADWWRAATTSSWSAPSRAARTGSSTAARRASVTNSPAVDGCCVPSPP